MQRPAQELAWYHGQGLLFLPGHCTSQERPGCIIAQEGAIVPPVYGVHRENKVMGRVVGQLIASEVSVRRWTINRKAARTGDFRAWCQDASNESNGPLLQLHTSAPMEHLRPAFLCGRDCRALTSWQDDLYTAERAYGAYGSQP